MQDIISRLSPETIGAMLSTLRYLDQEAKDGFSIDDVNIDHVRATLAKVDADLARARAAAAPAATLSIAAE